MSACVLLVVCTLSQSQFSHISLCMHVVAFALIRGVFGSAVLACTHFRSWLCSIVRVGEAMFGCVFVYVCFVRMTVGVCWSVGLGCHVMIVSMGCVC